MRNKEHRPREERSSGSGALFVRALLVGLLASLSPALAQASGEEANGLPAAEQEEEGASKEDKGEPASKRPVVEETITVIGQKKERARGEVGESVAIMTGEELEESTIDDLYDVVLATPNVDQAFGEKGFTIRGIDQRGAGGSGTGLLVNTNVDGATLHFNQATFFGPYSTWDLEQVEIHRGSQSTQQGRNALAGAIYMRGARPRLDDFFGKVRLSAAERGEAQYAAALNVPLIEDVLGFRVALERRERDGFVTNPVRGTDEYDARESELARGTLLYAPNERFSAALTFNYSESFGGEDIIVLTDFPDERPNFSDEPAREGSVHRITSLELRYQLTPGWELVSKSSTYDMDYERFEDGDLGPTPGSTLSRTGGGGNWTQELLFRHESESVSAVVGAFYGDFDVDLDAAGRFPGPRFGLPEGTTISTLFLEEQDARNAALFGDVDVRVAERWSLQAGLRWDDERLDVFTFNEVSVDPPILPSNPVDDRLDASYDALLPKLGLTYEAGPHTNMGVFARRAYRAGGRSNSIVDPAVFNEYDPEYAWTYEAFLRTVSASGRTRLLANLFYVDWTDQQVAVPSGTGAPIDFITVNAGESRTWGSELELRHVFDQRFSGFLSFGTIDTEFEDFESRGIDLAGNAFPYAPEFSAAIGVDFRHPSGVRATVDVSHKDEFFTDELNTALGTVDARTLVNARVGYEREGWGVFLFARNLFDEDYLYQLFETLDPLTGEPARAGRSGEPQTIGVTLDLRF